MKELFCCRNKLRSRPALLSPPTNAFASVPSFPSSSSAKAGPPRGRPPAQESAIWAGNQENLALPYSNLPTARDAAASALKQPETLARRQVLPPRQKLQKPSQAEADAASDSSPSSSASSSSSSSPPSSARAGQFQTGPRRASRQGGQPTAPRRASGQSKKTTALVKPDPTNMIQDSPSPVPGGAAASRVSLPESGITSKPSADMNIAASPGDLTLCDGCGRSFNPKAFEVHSRICAKVFQVSNCHIRDLNTEQF